MMETLIDTKKSHQASHRNTNGPVKMENARLTELRDAPDVMSQRKLR